MAILFIAVQCHQCSTMQVKQQKKSSNKWTCAVCNEKQSVLRVYTRGFQAKDIREFVQSFNMSRKFADERETFSLEEPLPVYDNEEEILAPESDGRRITLDRDLAEEKEKKKRRVDWSDYIEEDEIPDVESRFRSLRGEEDFEPKIVTELPEELFRKPKLKRYTTVSDGVQPKETSFYNPAFSKKDKENYNFKGTFERLHRSGVDGEGQSREENVQGKHNQSLNPKPTKSVRAAKHGAKWSEFIEEEEYEDWHCGGKKQTRCGLDGSSHGYYDDNSIMDERVEEDVHPDFI